MNGEDPVTTWKSALLGIESSIVGVAISFYATATHCQSDLLADQMNPIVSVTVVAAVVVGRVTVVEPNAVSHVKARADVVEEATEMMSF